MTLEEIGKVLVMEYQAYPQVALEPPLIKLWHDYFKDVDIKIFHNAFREAAKNSGNFPPTPATIKAKTDIIMIGIECLESADEAWSSIWRHGKAGDKQLTRISYKARECFKLIDDPTKWPYWDEKKKENARMQFIRIFNAETEKDKIRIIQQALDFETRKTIVNI